MFIFCLILLAFPVTLSAAPERVWSEGRYPYEGTEIEVSFVVKTESFSSNDKLKIEIISNCSMFQSKSLFFQNVNDQLQNKAHQIFIDSIEQCKREEKEHCKLDEEAISMDFDKREISYSLTPTYASCSLVSAFGEMHRYAGMPHGNSRYSSYNYWFDGQKMQNLSLSSLFLPDANFADFIIQFCLSTLAKEHIGYAFKSVDNTLIEMTRDDLRVFTLSKNGLTITFQPYHIGGWADGPYSITIPIDCLKSFINPYGPLREFF